MDIISKRDARNLRKIKYFTGKFCKHGHMSERYVNTGQCLDCLKAARRQTSFRSENPKIMEAEEILRIARATCLTIMSTAELRAKLLLEEAAADSNAAKSRATRSADIMKGLKRIKVACAVDAVPAYAGVIRDMVAVRFPDVTVDDVWPPGQHADYGVFYQVMVLPEDEPAIRQMEVLMRPKVKLP